MSEVPLRPSAQEAPSTEHLIGTELLNNIENVTNLAIQAVLHEMEDSGAHEKIVALQRILQDPERFVRARVFPILRLMPQTTISGDQMSYIKTYVAAAIDAELQRLEPLKRAESEEALADWLGSPRGSV